MEASTAYDNIINAIKAAEEAASKAGNAADSALSVSTHKWPNDGKLVTTRFFVSYRRVTKKTRASWCALLGCSDYMN